MGIGEDDGPYSVFRTLGKQELEGWMDEVMEVKSPQ